MHIQWYLVGRVSLVNQVVGVQVQDMCCKGMYKSCCVQSSMFEYTVVLVLLAPASVGTDV